MYIPDTFTNVRYVFSCAGIPEEMSFAHGIQAGLGMDLEEQLQICYDAFWQNVFETEAGIYQGWTWLGVRGTKMVGGEPFVAEVNQTWVGSVAGQTPVVNTALLVRKQTATGGRKGRGRMYWPCFINAESTVNNAGFLEVSDHGNIQGRITDWYDAMVAGDCVPYLFHSDPADAATLITGFSLQSQVATQRRRLR